MELIGVFLVLVVGLMVIGTICAIAENHKGTTEKNSEELPRVVVSQQVASVFDMFKKKK